MSYRQRAVDVMAHLVTHDWHGYSQYSREGDGGVETIALTDGTTAEIATGDRDCSSAVIDAWETARPGSTGGATYTGNMRAGFLSTGLWEWHPRGDGYEARPGDVYLNEAYHTAMCGPEAWQVMQFSISETGGVDGAEGDQTGSESNIRSYYDYPWDGVLAYVGEDDEDMQLTDMVDGWNGEASVAARLAGADYGANMAYNELKRTDDITGRGTVATMYERICYLGQKTDKILAALEQVTDSLDDLSARLDAIEAE